VRKDSSGKETGNPKENKIDKYYINKIKTNNHRLHKQLSLVDV